MSLIRLSHKQALWLPPRHLLFFSGITSSEKVSSYCCYKEAQTALWRSLWQQNEASHKQALICQEGKWPPLKRILQFQSSFQVTTAWWLIWKLIRNPEPEPPSLTHPWIPDSQQQYEIKNVYYFKPPSMRLLYNNRWLM